MDFINQLPFEMIVQILSHLEFHEHRKAMRVCKLWNEILREDPFGPTPTATFDFNPNCGYSFRVRELLRNAHKHMDRTKAYNEETQLFFTNYVLASTRKLVITDSAKRGKKYGNTFFKRHFLPTAGVLLPNLCGLERVVVKNLLISGVEFERIFQFCQEYNVRSVEVINCRFQQGFLGCFRLPNSENSRVTQCVHIPRWKWMVPTEKVNVRHVYWDMIATVLPETLSAEEIREIEIYARNGVYKTGALLGCVAEIQVVPEGFSEENIDLDYLKPMSQFCVLLAGRTLMSY